MKLAQIIGLQQISAYDPSESRDEHGRWTVSGFLHSLPEKVTTSRPIETLQSTTPLIKLPNTPDFKFLRQQLDAFTGKSAYGISVASKDILEGKYHTKNTDVHPIKNSGLTYGIIAENLIGLINQSPVTNSEIARGITGGSKEEAELSSLKPGDTYDMGLKSFSFDHTVAHHFATNENNNGYILKVSGGVRALRLAALSNYPEQQEALIFGKFKVADVQKTNTGTIIKLHKGATK